MFMYLRFTINVSSDCSEEVKCHRATQVITERDRGRTDSLAQLTAVIPFLTRIATIKL